MLHSAMIRLLLRLTLLALTAHRTLTQRTVTEIDPNQPPNQPLLRWPTLIVKPYRTYLKCVPLHSGDPNYEEIWDIYWYRNSQFQTQLYQDNQPGAPQMNSSDPLYRFRATGFGTPSRDFREFSGTWTCRWNTKVVFQGLEKSYTSPMSRGLTIAGDESPLDCGVPWQDFPTNIPLRYMPYPTRRKRHAKSLSISNEISRREISGQKVEINQYKTKSLLKTNFGRIFNGSMIQIRSMPWVVSILIGVVENGAIQDKICTGGFLSNVWVLTAAKCFEGIQSLTQPPLGSCFVYGGTNGKWGGIGRPCKRIYKHPVSDFNAALIQLHDSNDQVQDSEKFEFRTIRNVASGTIYGSKICLPSNRRLDSFDQKECILAGYGSGSWENAITNQPMLGAIKVKMESLVTTFRYWNSILSTNRSRTTRDKLYYITHNVFLHGATPSLGDHGAPLICKLPRTKHWQLVGVAGGLSPWRNTYLATRASYLKGWIQTLMNGGTKAQANLQNHTCAPNDYKCGPYPPICIPNSWFTTSFLERAQRMDIALRALLDHCKAAQNIVARRVLDRSGRDLEKSAAVEIGRSSSDIFHPGQIYSRRHLIVALVIWFIWL